MATQQEPPPDVGIDALLDSSPDPLVHTSAAAEIGFVLAMVALVASPFSLTTGLALVTGLLALVLGVTGTATTSRTYVAGGGLVPTGLVLAFVALGIVGLRYVGLDTAFGDVWAPTLTSWLEALNELVRA